MRVSVSDFIVDYISTYKQLLDAIPPTDIESAISMLQHAFDQGLTIFIVGNGGSASTASHIACDLSKTVLSDRHARKRFRVISLTDNVPLITAWANDVSYDFCFSEQLRNLANADDLLIVVSGSGDSRSVLEAARTARELGLRSLGLLGFDGGAVKDLLDHSVIVPSRSYGHVEDAHLMLNHLATSFFRDALQS